MALVYIAGSICATVPALFLGVNNGFTLLSVIVMAFAAYKMRKVNN